MNRTQRLWIGTNTKMYHGPAETADYITALTTLLPKALWNHIQLFVIPPFVSLSAAQNATDSYPLLIGAQNMCWAERGQFTGEISPLMLRELKVHLVMIGHSERRHTFRERDEEENKKILSALNHNLLPLLCIGEMAVQRANNVADEVLRMQLKCGLKNVTPEQASNCLIAYEPVWAIGEGAESATPEYAQARHAAIRGCLTELFGETGKNIPLL